MTLLLTLGAAYQIAVSVAATGVAFTPRSGRWLLAAGLLGLALVEAFLLLRTWTPRRTGMLERQQRLEQWAARRRALAWGIFLLSLALFPALVFYPPVGSLVQALYPRLLVFWLFVLLDSLLLLALRPQTGWITAAGAAMVCIAGVYRLALFLPEISNLPFSLGWSEASRFYYASLFFAEQLYGQPLHPTVLHPSRYLMQAVPFLIPDLPLWAHRLWQVLLWLGTSLGSGLLLARRLPVHGKARWLLFVGWSALFLFQGPVYYHLLVPVMIVLATFDARHFWRSLFGVLLASAWAGISRVNWMPVPGLLAGTLYLLEAPFWVGVRGATESTERNNGGKSPGSFSAYAPRALRLGGDSLPGSSWVLQVARYLAAPVVWCTLGTLAAFGAQALYIRWSGNPARAFASSFSSDLLWYRLFPNATYPLGLLPSVLLVAAPVLVLFALALRRLGSEPGPAVQKYLRPFGLAAVLAVLLVVGLIVSVKIGGGSNLHNLDSFLVHLWVTGSYLLFSEALSNSNPQPAAAPAASWIPAPLGLALVLLPALFAVTSGGPVRVYDMEQAGQSVRVIQKWVDRTLEEGKPVLFISERQLLTFGYIEAPLFADYEKVFLMEMVMAMDPDYLHEFRTDIETQRFGMIVTDPLFDKLKDPEVSSWAEENNAWVDHVADRVMCYYRRQTHLDGFGVQILVPKAVPQGCP